MRMRRLLAPLALAALAALIGIFVLGGPPAGASTGSPTAAAPAVRTAGMVPASPSMTPDEIAGQALFASNCSSCHGPDAAGVGGNGPKRGPSLLGVGGAIISLFLQSGWMPLAEPTLQPENKPPRFNQHEISQIVAYITSLSPGGVAVPTVNLKNADIATGFQLFSLNCAGCHTITGFGDAIAEGYHAPSLHGVTAVMVAEAIETGPGNMPDLKGNFTPAEINDVADYVINSIQHPASPGGLSLGGVGPVAEGFVGLLAGVGACVLVAFWVGDRTEREEEAEHEGPEGQGSSGGPGHGGGPEALGSGEMAHA